MLSLKEPKMTKVSDIVKMIKSLSDDDKAELKSLLLSPDTNTTSNLECLATDIRYAGGRVCPHCGSIHVVRNGHQPSGSQRYICCDCGKSFSVTSNTIVSGTKKDMSIWEKYIDCMMHGLSIREAAEICGIHRNTAFYWRHKILDALQDMANSVVLDGIVEADETFFPVSYKGNHSKDANFTMPRAAHKRGGETRVRGLSREQVCVPCAVNRSGMAIAAPTNLGRVSSKDIKSLLGSRIDNRATLVTDKMNSYIRFAKNEGIRLIQVKSGRSKRGIYNVQRVNSYHSTLSRFMRRFNGVSTKYLNNYLVWNNFVNYAPETDSEKKNILIRFILTTPKTVLCRGISDRNPLPMSA